MPYIKQEMRKVLDEAIEKFDKCFGGGVRFLPPGSLNYIITKLLLMTQPKDYTDYNALVGVLESCKLEFYRRAVAAFEEKKKEQNGDVY